MKCWERYNHFFKKFSLYESCLTSFSFILIWADLISYIMDHFSSCIGLNAFILFCSKMKGLPTSFILFRKPTLKQPCWTGAKFADISTTTDFEDSMWWVSPNFDALLKILRIALSAAQKKRYVRTGPYGTVPVVCQRSAGNGETQKQNTLRAPLTKIQKLLNTTSCSRGASEREHRYT